MRALGILALALALALAAGHGVARAQEGPVVVRSEIDRAAITMGDQVLLTITVELAKGYEVLDPGVPRAIGDLEVVDTLTVLQTRMQTGETRMQLRYLVSAFELGAKRLPVIVVSYRGPDGTRGEARTPNGHVITVASVIQPDEDASDIKPLKPPLPLPGTANDLSRALTFVGVAALILAAAVLALRVRRRRPVLAEIPAHGPARAALDELERVMELGLPEQGRTREHYDLVAAALRAFVARRYGLAAAARTARELRRELEHAGVGATAARLLCEVLSDAEAVRYERRPVSLAQARRSTRDVVELMRKSVIAEEYELVGSGATA